MEELKQKPYVYVLDKNGSPVMPTRRYGWVRRALKSGKAVAVQTLPFTIRLTYDTETQETQPVVAGIDPGRKNIGITCVRADGTALYRAKCETRNKDIPRLMQKRRVHRQMRRRGERLARKRLAKRLGTTMKAILYRKLPGYGNGMVAVKDIINTEARFNNRKRSSKWLTPTATHLLRTHLNLLQKVRKLLPVTDVGIEMNQFDFVRLDNPKTYKSLYGNGPRKGYGSEHDAVSAMQDGKCLLCGCEGFAHVHHLVPRTKGGSESLANKAGLCKACHDRVHKSAAAAEQLSDLKKGLNKKYGALSVLNQIIPFLADSLSELFPGHVYVTDGRSTKRYREACGFTKDHDIDAYCIAMSAFGFPVPDTEMPACYRIVQYKNHDRAKVKAQVARSYYMFAGWKDTRSGRKPDMKKVAQNRRHATEITYTEGKEEKLPPLDEWYAQYALEHGEKAAKKALSQLAVKPSYRRYNNTERHLPGAIFIFEGKKYRMTGQITNGAYFRAEGCERNYPAKECTVIDNRGLVYAA